MFAKEPEHVTMKSGDPRRNGKFGTRVWMRKIAELKRYGYEYPKGEDSHRAKITEATVKKIREPVKMPRERAKAYARLYGISEGYVYHLRARRRWKHLK